MPSPLSVLLSSTILLVFPLACSDDFADGQDAAVSRDAAAIADASSALDADPFPSDASMVSEEELIALASEILDGMSKMVDHVCMCEPDICMPNGDEEPGLGPVTAEVRACYIEGIMSLAPTDALKSDLMCLTTWTSAALTCIDLYGCDEGKFNVCMEPVTSCMSTAGELFDDCLFDFPM